MKDLNQVVLWGTVVRDFGYNVLNNGSKAVNFDLAVNNGNDKEGNEKQASFFRCTMYGDKVIDNLCTFVGRGTQILITGELKQRIYQKDDERRTTTYILVNSFRVISRFKTDRQDQEGDMSVNEVWQPEEGYGDYDMSDLSAAMEGEELPM